ncbi:YciI family protein [Wandonia haliotis]
MATTSLKKGILFLLVVLGSIWSAFGQQSYDSELADSLGADAYGMRMYQLVILKTGTEVIEDKELVQKLFRGHLDNIGRLAEEGKLVVAGPLGKNELEYRGIFIFKLDNKEEIQELLKTDPAIEAGIFDVEILDWYGSAALPMYLPYHKQIEKEQP